MKVLLLGLIQGLTEFLPVSSSGHIVILGKFLQVDNLLFLNIILHTGSLLAIFLFFFKDIIGLFSSFSYSKNKSLYLVVATIPTAIIGLFIKKYYSLMEDIVFVSFMLIVTGVILLTTRLAKEKKDIGIVGAFVIGVFQGIAVIPGISRSGITISTGLHLGMKREDAFNFSFLIVIPAILGAILLETLDVIKNPVSFDSFGLYTLGFLSSFISSIIALKFLSLVIKKNKIYFFGLYCILIGLIGIIGG